jgi:hypothetical protein
MLKLRKRFFASAALAAVLLSNSVIGLAAFDEGMYAPDQISQLTFLRARGLRIRPTDIYNPSGGGLTDAIVRLSIGCTAEFVSPDGLILTNHHCGFDALVSASTPAKDLVETGFNAGSRTGEIRAMNGQQPYSILLTQRFEDVTDKIAAGTANLTGDAYNAAIKKNTDDLTAAEQAKAPKGATIRIQSIDNGVFYYLYQTTELKDIRVVYAPPRNIGVFGGDPDNFEWTRHTGDFTFLRAYASPDGTPADYSPGNVPYHPKKFLTQYIGGLKDKEFTFTLGFPASTTRYRESWSVDYNTNTNFPFLTAWLRELGDALRRVGQNDEAKRIALQGDVANYDNSRKAYEGGAIRLKQAHAVDLRRAEETKLAAWIAANPARQAKYGTVLNDLRRLSTETNAMAKRNAIIQRFPDNISMPVFQQIVAAAASVKSGKKLTGDQKAEKKKEIEAALTDREPVLESDMLKFFLRQLDELPADQRFAGADAKFNNTKGKARRDLEAAYANDIATGPFATDPGKIADLYDDSWDKIQKNHPFVAALVDEKTALAGRTAKFNVAIPGLRMKYMEALTEMRGTHTVYPDANFTMRFSYGNVAGYQSREAEYRTPFTTLKGVFEKETGVFPFDVPPKLHELAARRDFGRYGVGDTVPVNFLTNNDIIGGNSGSPVLNGDGQQVGILFDGNFEGLGNDFYFDPDTNRTIACDIRYVLFVTEKFGNAKWVVDEMKIVSAAKSARG